MNTGSLTYRNPIRKPVRDFRYSVRPVLQKAVLIFLLFREQAHGTEYAVLVAVFSEPVLLTWISADMLSEVQLLFFLRIQDIFKKLMTVYTAVSLKASICSGIRNKIE